MGEIHTQIDMDMLVGGNDKNDAYDAFVDKFKPKLTTDDCYTPENIYEAVRAWVFERYQLAEDTPIVRPFWPGGDYKAVEYLDNCVVIDNPPFSIIGEIERWYLRKGIKFFLFAPALTIFKNYNGLKYVLVDTKITYANGAKVATSFVTNMGEYLVEVSSRLHEAVDKENSKNEKEQTKQLPKYEMPPEVATAAKLRMIAKHGVDLKIKEKDAVCIGAIDSMKEQGKAIFGRGLLLSKKAAAEKAAAEKAAEKAAAEKAAAEKAAEKENVIVWELSDRERKMVEHLGEE